MHLFCSLYYCISDARSHRHQICVLRVLINFEKFSYICSLFETRIKNYTPISSFPLARIWKVLLPSRIHIVSSLIMIDTIHPVPLYFFLTSTMKILSLFTLRHFTCNCYSMTSTYRHTGIFSLLLNQLTYRRAIEFLLSFEVRNFPDNT